MLLLCSRCGNVVILNEFKTGINIMSFLPVFLSCVLGVFNSPVATPAHGLLGLSPSFLVTIYIGERELVLYIYATTHGPTSLSC